MSSNTITINDDSYLEWEIADDKMPLLMGVLSTLGEPCRALKGAREADRIHAKVQEGALAVDETKDVNHGDITTMTWSLDTHVLIAKIQKGPIKEVGLNGVQIDAVINRLNGILCSFHNRCPSKFTTAAILCINAALEVLAARTEEREKRGVESSYQP